LLTPQVMLQLMTEQLSNVSGGREEGRAVPRSNREDAQLYVDCVGLANEQMHTDARRESSVVAVSNGWLNLEGCKRNAWDQIKLMQARREAPP
jgi:hypothetical protein